MTGRQRHNLTQAEPEDLVPGEPTSWPRTPLLQAGHSESELADRPPFPIQNHPSFGSSVSTRHHLRIVSDSGEVGTFVTLMMLVVLGLRPKRLQAQLDAADPTEWNAFRDGLIKRWGTLGITSGLVLSATTSMILSNIPRAAWVAAFASLCASIVSIVFGTALSFIFADAPGEDIMLLALRPIHMVFLLSIPNLFAMGSMLSLYLAITIFAWASDNGIATILTRIGTTAGAVVMLLLFVYSAWLVGDMSKQKRQAEEARYGESKEARRV
ncbi:hypothetical protein C8J56DRAFT_420249 [Mycena floridula]|nr:hypothetical protein C8J56DRAFT_420249 [Mycena floridula]